MATERYNPRAAEPRWQAAWNEARLFEADNDDPRPKYYVLEMFPYPSGRIHVGHVRNYAMGDVVARYKRAKGFNVLHPMGWDAFGMPAENAAMENKDASARMDLSANIDDDEGSQLKSMGLSLDWSARVRDLPRRLLPPPANAVSWTSTKTAWIARKSSKVNWDPVDQTVLANEQVIDGRGWRSGAPGRDARADPVVLPDHGICRRPSGVDSIRAGRLAGKGAHRCRRNWIGRSEGMLMRWEIDGKTARPTGADVLRGLHHADRTRFFGASFMALSAEHPLAVQAVEVNPELDRILRRMPAHGWTTRSKPSNRPRKKGFRHRDLVVRHPFDPELDPAGLRREFRADGVRHRRRVRLPVRRPARPRFCQQVRPSGPARGDPGWRGRGNLR